MKSVPLALGVGYRLIDTSDNYGNEEWVGKGLNSVDSYVRNEVVVVTKFSQPMRTARLSEVFAESQAKLGGRVDLYLLHWPYPFLWRQQWRRMEELQLAGRCGAIGVCNFGERRLRKLLRICRVKPVADQIELHPLFQQRAITEFCKENGITVMSYSPLARGDADLMGNCTLKGIAAKHGKTAGQVILRWNIEHGFVPIPASTSEGHIVENCDVFDFSLAEEEIDAIDALERGKRVRFDPDKRFSTKQKIKFLAMRIALAFSEADGLLRRR